MSHKLAAKVQEWVMEVEDFDYNALHAQIEYNDKRLFREYLPTIGPHPDFMNRLNSWLENVSMARDQKILFRLVPDIFFIPIEGFYSLYRSALRHVVVRWLIDELKIEFTSRKAETDIKKAIKETWFCPITDSMQIAAFYHANNIEGIDMRPDWRSLEEFGSPDKIRRYMGSNDLKRLVLIEDFVGSGSQIRSTLEFAIQSLGNKRILLTPLLICPEGVEMGRLLEAKSRTLTFMPVLSLPKEVLVHKIQEANKTEILKQVAEIVQRMDRQVKGNNRTGYYGPFGYKETGALIVMHSNCPDNTLPIIRHSSNTWTALFPRSSRL
jgi:hypothetical protein